MKKKFSIAISSGYGILREGLNSIFTKHTSCERVSVVKNYRDLIECLSDIEYQVVLVDVDMQEDNLFDCIEKIQQIDARIVIAVLTGLNSKLDLNKLLSIGVKGVLLQSVDPQKLVETVESLLDDKTFYSSELMHKYMLHSMEYKQEYKEEESILTKREIEILHLISGGLSNQEISVKLNISPCTVNNHRANLLAKTGAKNSASLVMYAVRNGLLEIYEPEYKKLTKA